jgi:hypothetical protein
MELKRVLTERQNELLCRSIADIGPQVKAPTENIEKQVRSKLSSDYMIETVFAQAFWSMLSVRALGRHIYSHGIWQC